MTFPDSRLAIVVAMACDKDHLAFAKELLSGKNQLMFFMMSLVNLITAEVDKTRMWR